MEKREYAYFEAEEAYVVFVDNVSLWWLKILKEGFRHCYMLMKIRGSNDWLELNPYSNQLKIKVYKFSDSFDYIYELKKDKKLRICGVKIKNAPLKCAPLSFFTCVEMVKRVLGIHSFGVITPYQLYKKIMVVGKKS